MKVRSGSSAAPRHAGTAPRTPPPFRPFLVFCSFFFAARGEGENKRNGQVGYTKHIRLYGTSANWPASFLALFFFFFPLFLQLGDINPNPPGSFLGDDEKGVGRIVARARRAWSESPCEIEPSKKFRNRALNSESVLSLSPSFSRVRCVRLSDFILIHEVTRGYGRRI